MGATFVLDASVGVRIVAEEEAGHLEALQRFEILILAEAEFFAPPLYVFEVANALARAKRKDGAVGRLQDAAGLPQIVQLSVETLERAFGIALDGKLSFYDASYVALAEQTSAILWTEDKEILKRFPAVTANTAELSRRLR